MMHTGLCSADGTAVPLQGVEVTGELLAAHARVTVRQRYRNVERVAIEAIYTFPLPADAVLAGFAMTAEGRRVEGAVQEREAAFRDYDKAVYEGHGAALLEQERSNVFTATLGNLLPGETALLEVTYLQRLRADEGALRWTLPTLVAPRYIPGTAQGDRTAHGTADPTTEVSDADRISPPSGDVRYGLTLDLSLDLGRDLVVESPSHSLSVVREGAVTRVRFSDASVALDRDVVVLVRDASEVPLAALVAHRVTGSAGYFALGVVPDLFDARKRSVRKDVVFLIDTSGSMDGRSIDEARMALRLCLRHLREGDRFAIAAFADSARWLHRELVPFTQKTLEEADKWVASLSADGGTELREPLLEAVTMAPDGVIVLLTDGQVGNEDSILSATLAARRTARVYSFGIGTNVSDALLRDLAKRTRAEVEFIHPGERIDEKVVAVFARAAALRVTDLKVNFEGVEVTELSPAETPDLVDGEPWTLLGRYDSPGVARATLRGRLGDNAFAMEVPVVLPAEDARPALAKLWAGERVRDLEGTAVTDPRRAKAMRERIVALAVEHSIASRYTSFVLVEKRTGERRASGLPETRVVPVHLPAGWAMFDATRAGGGGRNVNKTGRRRRAGMAAAVIAYEDIDCLPCDAVDTYAMPLMPAQPVAARLAPASPARPRSAGRAAMAEAAAPPPAQGTEAWRGLLQSQLASGLWGAPGADEAERAKATADALATLVREGITATHPTYGPQVRKAVEALIEMVARGVGSLALVAYVLAACTAAGSGRRTMQSIDKAAAARGTAGHLALLGAELDALESAARAAP